MKKRKFLIENANLTGITDFLNKNFSKKVDKEFTCRDVLGYVQRKSLPSYLGGQKIEEIAQNSCSIKLYNIIEK